MSKVRLVVTPSSVSSLKSSLQELEKRAYDYGKLAVSQEIELAFAEAQERCPVYTGATKNSGQTHINVSGAEIEGIISYGTSYAPERHESITHRNPGAFKWLERTMLDRSAGTESSLGRTYSFMFGGG